MINSTYVTFYDKKNRPHYIGRSTSPVADTHTHLISRTNDISAVLTEAAQVGVDLVITPLDPMDEARDAQRVLAQLEEASSKVKLSPTIGILAGAHPYHAVEFIESDKSAFETLLASPFCVGIGEIGLDYTCDVPKGIQMETFCIQLAQACKMNLPVELHIRDAKDDKEGLAHRDAERLIQKVGIPTAGVVLHCFTQGISVMEPYLEMGCTIAFGGALTFKKSDDIREAARVCPLENMVVETDAPYMTPEPLRGISCRCAHVVIVEDFLTNLLKDAGRVSKREAEAALWQNAKKLFLPKRRPLQG